MEITDGHISVRFKHGVHTIYLFVDTLEPIQNVGEELRSLLRERYPDGLTTSIEQAKTTPVPSEDEDFTMAYAVLAVPNDPTRGWKRLKFGDESTPAGKAGLKDNGIVAFTFLQSEDDEAVFEVEWPGEDEELYE
ncbi:unnamed protein product [Clonostachys rosea f. rosea IK726]|jgi:hypothetical protein|nr:unnamed protein product [Clonostachys rosea f. rosea IK726]